MIALRDVVARKGRFALEGVNVALAAGEYGVVIGPAGSGKTTLLEVIAGLLPSVAGSVMIGGADGRRLAPEDRHLSLVYQHAYLFPHLSVRDNVAYGAADAQTLREVEARFDVGAYYSRDVLGLSGGERQVVALARALARRPRLLLLDEPFSALDPRRRTLVRREVRQLHRDWGLTTLQVTHDFAEAGMLGDRAILLDAGRVLQQGTPAEVFRRPASPYVAEFLGAENVFAGVAREIGEVSPDWVEGDPAMYARGHRAFAFETDGLTLYAVGDFASGAGHAVIRAEEITVAR
ncbi:MAG TPA: ATP-binding cassette domain-containing protein, partial [Gemmatimonadaceae bacterium]|nr:ATP-binding cassette domain-containing protein [Gemmatimonadaceae bacterium]